MTEENSKKLYERAIILNAIKFGEFTLSSGQKSSYYFDGRLLSMDPFSSNLITEIFIKKIIEFNADAFGGPSVAAVPIIGALTLKCHFENIDLSGFFVRSEQKKHGTNQQIEGLIKPGMNVAVFDDTLSTGDSLLNSIKAVEDYGCKVVLALTILDRQQGAKEKLNVKKIPLFKLWEASTSGEIKIL